MSIVLQRYFVKPVLDIFLENILQLFSLLHCSIGRRSTSREDTEEEQFTAVLMLMEILTNLLSKDFLSFAAGLIASFLMLNNLSFLTLMQYFLIIILLSTFGLSTTLCFITGFFFDY